MVFWLVLWSCLGRYSIPRCCNRLAFLRPKHRRNLLQRKALFKRGWGSHRLKTTCLYQLNFFKIYFLFFFFLLFWIFVSQTLFKSFVKSNFLLFFFKLSIYKKKNRFFQSIFLEKCWKALPFFFSFYIFLHIYSKQCFIFTINFKKHLYFLFNSLHVYLFLMKIRLNFYFLVSLLYIYV